MASLGTLLLLLFAAVAGAQDGERAPQAPGAPPGSSPESERLTLLTEPLLGTPYRRSPLGEGSGRDPDPRLRLDAFDCTTFVETALAMLFAPSADAVAETLDRLRYEGGHVAWESRLHLIAAQWLPSMHRDGRLLDVTEEIGGLAARIVASEPRRHWVGSSTERQLGLSAERIPEAGVRLPYLPWDQVGSLLATWPEPLVLSVVRAPTEREPLLVRHQALFLPGDGGAVVRHASQRLGRVVDQDLAAFVSSFATSGTNLGLNAQRILAADR